jgi:hypothetical protein
MLENRESGVGLGPPPLPISDLYVFNLKKYGKARLDFGRRKRECLSLSVMYTSELQ